jgi:superfamily II DNA helicase RecQ
MASMVSEFDASALSDIIYGELGYRPRPFQVEAARAVCAGQDTVVIAYTGAGKSLIFKAIGLASPHRPNGMVIIITPLKALQVEQAEKCVQFHRQIRARR